MTPDQARIVLLEQDLTQALHTIVFLRDCLKGNAKHMYPEHTELLIEHLRRVVPKRDPCGHSAFNQGCSGCITRHDDFVQAIEAAKVLNIPTEPGRRPTL